MTDGEKCFEHARGTAAYNLPVKPSKTRRNQYGATYCFADGSWFWQSTAFGYRKWGAAGRCHAVLIGGGERK